MATRKTWPIVYAKVLFARFSFSFFFHSPAQAGRRWNGQILLEEKTGGGKCGMCTNNKSALLLLLSGARLLSFCFCESTVVRGSRAAGQKRRDKQRTLNNTAADIHRPHRWWAAAAIVLIPLPRVNGCPFRQQL